LTTGFDAPKTSAVVIARPTTSIVLLSQMAGRAIRGVRVGGNRTAKMVTVVDTAIPELVETIDQFHAFDESWETN
jgi:superfamily II DNA or RNA helicase